MAAKEAESGEEKRVDGGRGRQIEREIGALYLSQEKTPLVPTLRVSPLPDPARLRANSLT